MAAKAADFLVYDKAAGVYRENPEQAVRDDVEKHAWRHVGVTILKDWRLYLMLLKGQAPLFAFSVSFCTGAALLAAMVLSSVAGTAIPILFKRLGVDPAVASGPLITTVNDLVAVVAYYGLAWGLLIHVLHF